VRTGQRAAQEDTALDLRRVCLSPSFIANTINVGPSLRMADAAELLTAGIHISRDRIRPSFAVVTVKFRYHQIAGAEVACLSLGLCPDLLFHSSD